MQEDEGRRVDFGQQRRLLLRNAIPCQPMSRGRAERRRGPPRPVDDGKRDELGNFAPALPAMQLAEDVGAHDPDEPDARTAPPEVSDRVMRVAGADLRL